jgi:hypothetical protein
MMPVLIHKPVFFITYYNRPNNLFRFLSDNRTLTDLQERFLSALDDEARFLDLFDLADHTAIGYDLVIDLKLPDHFGKLLFLPLLRQYNEEIEDAKDQCKRCQSPNR